MNSVRKNCGIIFDKVKQRFFVFNLLLSFRIEYASKIVAELEFGFCILDVILC